MEDQNILLNISIPNFNYAGYLDLALASLKAQTDQDFRVFISDNASTDGSMEVIRKWATEFNHYQYSQNTCNVGFAGNLDRVAGDVGNGYNIMLSSDDIVLPDTVKQYKKFITLLKSANPGEKFMFGSIAIRIDSDGKEIAPIHVDRKLWFESDIDDSLSKAFGAPVHKVAGGEMLRRCLTQYKTPLHFITACYPMELYHQVGGYGGGRMYGPDKWFHWKILSVTDYVYLIDNPLFEYRWHQNNQAALQQKSGALKYWVDEYRNSFETDAAMLKKAGMSQDEMISAFCTLVHKYTVSALMQGDKTSARRLFRMGGAFYPEAFRRNKLFMQVWILLCTYPLSYVLLKLVRKS
jgi:glycosyltransferase involved in cell wall biosynthesis